MNRNWNVSLCRLRRNGNERPPSTATCWCPLCCGLLFVAREGHDRGGPGRPRRNPFFFFHHSQNLHLLQRGMISYSRQATSCGPGQFTRSPGRPKTFSLASFSRDCYIAAMSDGQSGGNISSTEIRDDGALLRAVATCDKDAFQQLYTRHGPLLFYSPVKILGDRTEAEDVLQETFVQVWKTAATFDDQRGKPLAWFIMLTRSRAIDRLRSRKTRARLAESVGKEETQITRAKTLRLTMRLPPRRNGVCATPLPNSRTSNAYRLRWPISAA